MDNPKSKEVADFAARIVTAAFTCGLTWDAAVSALGIATMAISEIASTSGDGTKAECIALARDRLNEGLSRTIDVNVELTPADHVKSATEGGKPEPVIRIDVKG